MPQRCPETHRPFLDWSKLHQIACSPRALPEAKKLPQASRLAVQERPVLITVIRSARNAHCVCRPKDATPAPRGFASAVYRRDRSHAGETEGNFLSAGHGDRHYHRHAVIAIMTRRAGPAGSSPAVVTCWQKCFSFVSILSPH